MKKVKNTLLIMVSLLFVAVTFILVQRSRNPACNKPIILGYLHDHNQPEELANQFISNLGGLPKAELDIGEAENIIEAGGTVSVYPVDSWHILTSLAANPANLDPFPSSNAAYTHHFRMQVNYADGDEAILQWSSWSYGFVACPFIISQGSGPPGQLEVVQ